MPFPHGQSFLIIRPGPYTTRSVEAGPLIGLETVDTRITIDIVHPIPVHIHDCGIILKPVATPSSSVKA